MKNPVTPLNNWIITKIINFLTSKEGCEVKLTEHTLEGCRTVLHDSFGFRYEIQIKTIGRVDSDFGDMEKYLNRPVGFTSVLNNGGR